jgi:hypothetical protein
MLGLLLIEQKRFLLCLKTYLECCTRPVERISSSLELTGAKRFGIKSYREDRPRKSALETIKLHSTSLPWLNDCSFDLTSPKW